MMNRSCLSDGELRHAVEHGTAAGSGHEQHLQTCAGCRKRMHQLRAAAMYADERLATLHVDDHEIDVRSARIKLRNQIALSGVGSSERPVQGESIMSSMWKYRAARGAIAMLAVLVLTTAFVATPMRSLADNLFNRFEVEEFEAITIQPAEFTEFGLDLAIRAFTADQERLMAAAETLYEVETTFDQDNIEGNALKLDSVDEARDAYGAFKLPSSLPEGFVGTPEFLVSESGSATVTLDTASVHVIIDELRLPITSIPSAAEMPEMVFQADIPSALVTHYSDGRDGHLAVVQMASPTITTPEGVDMDALRDDILSLPGLPEDFVAQLRAIDDWQKTLVIPVPEGAETRDVTVDGNGGLLIEAGAFDGSEWGIDIAFDGELSVVMWNDDGTLYVVAGTLDGDALLDVAGSLR